MAKPVVEFEVDSASWPALSRSASDEIRELRQQNERLERSLDALIEVALRAYERWCNT
jgi:hypothetical protein